MSTDRFKTCVDLHLVLRDENGRVLLGERRNTGYMDGAFHFVAGHLEDGESARTGVIREALEEAGIVPEDPALVHVMHHYTDSGRIALFYEATRWTGTIANREENKCAGWQWFTPDALPEMIPYAADALDHIGKGVLESERGWTGR
ncbi:NUDIX domain-containing protein [Streptomyces sp. NPDC004539]|uniref:NUDIX hydrolase n=1 Tax=Streptomyces sp. NPDC004539 TaxID=3154280 RepID=UPI00339EC8B9